MFNKNVFTQTDVVADLIKGINEADYKAKMEALKGNQHKIDKNKNNKIDAHDFKLLRGEKKVNEDQVEEGNNPFDVKNYKSQIPTKPGEKAGFDSKKISTGTVYSRKPVKDEPMKKEEIDPEKVTTDTLAGRVKGKTANPFAPKKVMMDVSGNVNEEDLDEEVKVGDKVSFDLPMKAIPGKTMKKVGTVHKVEDDTVHIKVKDKYGVITHKKSASELTKEEVEELDELSPKTLKSYAKKSEPQAISSLAAAHDKVYQHIDKTGKAPSSEKQVMKIAGKEIMHAAKRTKGLERVQNRLAKEEVEELDEGLGHFVVKQMARLANKSDLQDHHINVAQKKVDSDLGTGHPQADNILNKHKKLARDAQYHKKSDDEARQHFADNMQTLHNDLKSARGVKEEVEMNERELSKGETAEKERIVKGMKKSLAGFKSRYGDKAKSVMYATATARAKKD